MEQWINGTVIFLLGLSIGSFLNVLIDRLPKEESIMGRSHCDHCRRKLAWYDLLPIVSYFYLGARCRYCKKRLSFFYPLVELVTGVMFVFVISLPSFNLRGSPVPIQSGLLNRGGSVAGALLTMQTNFLHLLALLGIVSCAIVIFFTDLKYQIIPDSIQVALFIFALILKIIKLSSVGCIQNSLFHCSTLPAGRQVVPLLAGFGDGVVVMLPILLLFLVTKGKAMGFGDVKLAFNLGFLLGILDGLFALYIGFVSGAVVGLILIFLGKKRLKSKIAFGPFLVLGLIIILFFGDLIVQKVRTMYSF